MGKATTPWRKPTLWEMGPEFGVDLQVPHFDVTDNRFAGGAAGDGVTDDSDAFQAAITAAIAANGRLVIPTPATNYVLTRTINIAPASGTQVQLHIDMIGKFSHIKWAGGNNTSIFKSYGWKNSTISNVHVRLGAATGIVVWDVDHDAVRLSTSHLNWENCLVSTDGGQSGCVGWRIGHTISGTVGAEFSYMNWTRCAVNWDALTGTPLGWVMEDNNGLVLTWTNCQTTFCARGWTTTSTSGAAQANGGGSMFFYGCGATGNAVDFDLTSTMYLISGGRYELGQKFIQMASGSTANVCTIQNVQIAAYSPGDGIIFENFRPGLLILDNCQVFRNGAGADYTANMLRLSVGSGRPATCIVRGGSYQAADPFFFSDGTYTIIEVENVHKCDGTGVVAAGSAGTFANRSRLDTVTPITYSGTMATDTSLSRVFTIAATNGTAFTISTPTNPVTGRTITYDIKNSSGGAMGAVTWGAGFLGGGAGTVGTGAFAGIANTKRRTISFYYDGTNWIELFRTADQ